MSVTVIPLANLAPRIHSVSRKSSQKFHDFFNTVLLNGAALGVVTEYFLKEYQSRGVPHSDIPLWIKDAAVAGRDDNGIILKWIQERISCSKDNTLQLHRLVTKYQYYKCNCYCQCRKRVRGSTFITHCRFGFPGRRVKVPLCSLWISARSLQINSPGHPKKQLQSTRTTAVEC